MKKLEVTAYDLAQRFVGVAEVNGKINNPQIMAMLRLDQSWPGSDEVPWCSGFVNYVAWLLRLPRSKSLAARSWLQVGIPIHVSEAQAGFDVVILQRGNVALGPDVIAAPGHVGFYAGAEVDEEATIGSVSEKVLLLGGNQGDEVNVSAFDIRKILGVRRLLA